MGHPLPQVLQRGSQKTRHLSALSAHTTRILFFIEQPSLLQFSKD
jgi:hypothetical protein